MGVKGRIEPAVIFALGYKSDLRFSENNIQQWDKWLLAIEQNLPATNECPDIFQLDKKSIQAWLARGLLGADGVWLLDQK
ncbi:MAG: hypothetical protein PSN04_10845 [Methyloprofundus sp.]|nr:hypothetical protein [Methyloprofundus sp.]